MESDAQVIEGSAIAAAIRRDAVQRLAQVTAHGVPVRVAVVSESSAPAARLYVARQRERFVAAGIACVHRELDGTATEADFLATIDALNDDPTITGIVVAVPLLHGVNVRRVQERIAPAKDIEGVHPHNLGQVTLGHLGTGPCTAQAVLEVLDATGLSVRGREAVVVGHSEIVGKPVALTLVERMATVTVCHAATKDLGAHTRRAEILVVAAGRPGLITADMVREGAVVIDVGMNRVTGEDGTPRMVGDVDFQAVRRRAGWITPVPGGVGPVTVAVLLRSAVLAAEAALRARAAAGSA